MCADLINKHFSDYSLLDVGCRTRDLMPLLQACKEYYGTDIMPAEGVFECNLEEGLKFKKGQFDIVVALDVIEHLENAHAMVGEMLRVARQAAFISLPNVHYASFRWRFLLGGGISGKYTFHKDPVVDRHRWVTSYTESVDFVRHQARGFEIKEVMIVPRRGRFRFISPIERWLARKWPNMFAYGVLFMITPPGK